MKTKRHYHVYVGLPGYLPNCNLPCETLKEAGDMAYEEALAFREASFARSWGSECQGKVTGNQRDGYEVLRPSLWDEGEWVVWQTITISPCCEVPCRCPQCGTLLHDDDGCECGWMWAPGEEWAMAE